MLLSSVAKDRKCIATNRQNCLVVLASQGLFLLIAVSVAAADAAVSLLLQSSRLWTSADAFVALKALQYCVCKLHVLLQVMDFLGSAAFSKAVQALDTKTGMLVCLKIIKVASLSIFRPCGMQTQRKPPPPPPS